MKSFLVLGFLVFVAFWGLAKPQSLAEYALCEALPVLGISADTPFRFTLNETDLLTCSTAQCNKPSSVQSVSTTALQLVKVLGLPVPVVNVGSSEGHCITTRDTGRGTYKQLCTQEYAVHIHAQNACWMNGTFTALGTFIVANPVPTAMWTIVGGTGYFAGITGNFTIHTDAEPNYENEVTVWSL